MIINLLLEFIGKCSLAKATPSERDIENFLGSVDALQYRHTFIKYCHYYWEHKTYDTKILEIQLETLK